MEPPRNGVADPGDGVARCWWCVGDPLNLAYHDLEWGRPVTDDTRLFEKICLEGFQSGLSWLTILRNRAKIDATVNNARRCAAVVEEFGSLAAYVWSFEPDAKKRPKRLDWPTLVGLRTPAEATAMSKDLKRRGWAFVGPTTIYSVMQ